MAKKMARPAGDYERVAVASVAELGDALAARNGGVGIWVVTFRKHVAGRHVSAAEVAEVAIAHGWIDSVPRALDDDRTMLLVAPRRKGSAWSRVNKETVARLRRDGRMSAAGEAVVQRAVADGSWTFLDDVEDLVVPDDLARALAAVPAAAERFDGFPRSVKRGILEWIKTAKTAPTRAKRIATTAQMAGEGRRANFEREAS